MKRAKAKSILTNEMRLTLEHRIIPSQSNIFFHFILKALKKKFLHSLRQLNGEKWKWRYNRENEKKKRNRKRNLMWSENVNNIFTNAQNTQPKDEITWKLNFEQKVRPQTIRQLRKNENVERMKKETWKEWHESLIPNWKKKHQSKTIDRNLAKDAEKCHILPTVKVVGSIKLVDTLSCSHIFELVNFSLLGHLMCTLL